MSQPLFFEDWETRVLRHLGQSVDVAAAKIEVLGRNIGRCAGNRMASVWVKGLRPVFVPWAVLFADAPEGMEWDARRDGHPTSAGWVKAGVEPAKLEGHTGFIEAKVAPTPNPRASSISAILAEVKSPMPAVDADGYTENDRVAIAAAVKAGDMVRTKRGVRPAVPVRREAGAGFGSAKKIVGSKASASPVALYPPKVYSASVKLCADLRLIDAEIKAGNLWRAFEMVEEVFPTKKYEDEPVWRDGTDREYTVAIAVSIVWNSFQKAAPPMVEDEAGFDEYLRWRWASEKAEWYFCPHNFEADFRFTEGHPLSDRDKRFGRALKFRECDRSVIAKYAPD